MSDAIENDNESSGATDDKLEKGTLSHDGRQSRSDGTENGSSSSNSSNRSSSSSSSSSSGDRSPRSKSTVHGQSMRNVSSASIAPPIEITTGDSGENALEGDNSTAQLANNRKKRRREGDISDEYETNTTVAVAVAVNSERTSSSNLGCPGGSGCAHHRDNHHDQSVVLTPDEAVVEEVINAVKRGDAREVEELLKRNVGPVSVEAHQGGRRLLWWAANHGHKGVVELLLKLGTSIEARDPADESTALHRAAWNGHAAVAALLLDNNADIESRTKAGNTPLALAARRGKSSVVRTLLARGADSTAVGANGETPIVAATTDDIRRELLMTGVDPERLKLAPASPFRRLNGDMGIWFECALLVLKYRVCGYLEAEAGFESYPFDRLSDEQKLLVMAVVSEAMLGVNNSLSGNWAAIPSDVCMLSALYESALYSVFASVKACVAEWARSAVAQQQHQQQQGAVTSNKVLAKNSQVEKKEREERLKWARLTVNAYEAEFQNSLRNGLAVANIERIKPGLIALLIDLLAVRFFGTEYLMKLDVFGIECPIRQRCVYEGSQNYFNERPPVVTKRAVDLAIRRLEALTPHARGCLSEIIPQAALNRAREVSTFKINVQPHISSMSLDHHGHAMLTSGDCMTSDGSGGECPHGHSHGGSFTMLQQGNSGSITATVAPSTTSALVPRKKGRGAVRRTGIASAYILEEESIEDLASPVVVSETFWLECVGYWNKLNPEEMKELTKIPLRELLDSIGRSEDWDILMRAELEYEYGELFDYLDEDDDEYISAGPDMVRCGELMQVCRMTEDERKQSTGTLLRGFGKRYQVERTAAANAASQQLLQQENMLLQEGMSLEGTLALKDVPQIPVNGDGTGLPVPSNLNTVDGSSGLLPNASNTSEDFTDEAAWEVSWQLFELHVLAMFGRRLVRAYQGLMREKDALKLQQELIMEEENEKAKAAGKSKNSKNKKKKKKAKDNKSHGNKDDKDDDDTVSTAVNDFATSLSVRATTTSSPPDQSTTSTSKTDKIDHSTKRPGVVGAGTSSNSNTSTTSVSRHDKQSGPTTASKKNDSKSSSNRHDDASHTKPTTKSNHNNSSNNNNNSNSSNGNSASNSSVNSSGRRSSPVENPDGDGVDGDDDWQVDVGDNAFAGLSLVSEQMLEKASHRSGRKVGEKGEGGAFSSPATLHGGVDEKTVEKSDDEDDQSSLKHTAHLTAGGLFPKNKPCPCGSGRKYRRCCLKAQDGETASDATTVIDGAGNYLNNDSRHQSSQQSGAEEWQTANSKKRVSEIDISAMGRSSSGGMASNPQNDGSISPTSTDNGDFPDVSTFDNHDQFLYDYKTKQCRMTHRREQNKWLDRCSGGHNEVEMRRDPRLYVYSHEKCSEYTQSNKCKAGNACPLAHGNNEQMFHPNRYKTKLCKDFVDHGKCHRGALCAFAHGKADQRRTVPHALSPEEFRDAIQSANERSESNGDSASASPIGPVALPLPKPTSRLTGSSPQLLPLNIGSGKLESGPLLSSAGIASVNVRRKSPSESRMLAPVLALPTVAPNPGPGPAAYAAVVAKMPTAVSGRAAAGRPAPPLSSSIPSSLPTSSHGSVNDLPVLPSHASQQPSSHRPSQPPYVDMGIGMSPFNVGLIPADDRSNAMHMQSTNGWSGMGMTAGGGGFGALTAGPVIDNLSVNNRMSGSSQLDELDVTDLIAMLSLPDGQSDPRHMQVHGGGLPGLDLGFGGPTTHPQNLGYGSGQQGRLPQSARWAASQPAFVDPSTLDNVVGGFNGDMGVIGVCHVCQERPVEVRLLPCGHPVCCYSCFQTVQSCPVLSCGVAVVDCDVNLPPRSTNATTDGYGNRSPFYSADVPSQRRGWQGGAGNINMAYGSSVGFGGGNVGGFVGVPGLRQSNGPQSSAHTGEYSALGALVNFMDE